MGFETVCPEKDRQTAFYSPLVGTQRKEGLALYQTLFFSIEPDISVLCKVSGA